MVGGGSFHVLHSLLHSILVDSILFSSPVTICFKEGMYLLHFSRESHAEIQSSSFWFTYVESKHQSNEHNQACANDFKHLIWILWVCWLSLAWFEWLFSINVSIWSLSTSTGLLDHGVSSSEKSLAWNFTNHFWPVRPVIAPSPYIAQICFCISVVFSPFLK